MKTESYSMCALPKGSEPHEPSELSIEGLEVRANHPIQFQLFESDSISPG